MLDGQQCHNRLAPYWEDRSSNALIVEIPKISRKSNQKAPSSHQKSKPNNPKKLKRKATETVIHTPNGKKSAGDDFNRRDDLVRFRESANTSVSFGLVHRDFRRRGITCDEPRDAKISSCTMDSKDVLSSPATAINTFDCDSCQHGFANISSAVVPHSTSSDLSSSSHRSSRMCLGFQDRETSVPACGLIALPKAVSCSKRRSVSLPAQLKYGSDAAGRLSLCASSTYRVPFPSPTPDNPAYPVTKGDGKMTNSKPCGSQTSGGETFSPANKEEPAFNPSTFHNAWQRISHVRLRVAMLRGDARILRSRLMELENAKALADDGYIKHVRIMTEQTPLPRAWLSERSSKDLLQNCQTLRDEYGSLLDDYVQLEKEWSNEEYQLTSLEERFYRGWAENFNSVPSQTDIEAIFQEPHYPEPQKLPPLVDTYLDKSGDLDNLQEEYDDILEEKLSLEGQLESKNLVGLTLCSEDQTWLQNSQSLLDELSPKIAAAKAEVRYFFQKCHSLGLVDDIGDPIEWSVPGEPLTREADNHQVIETLNLEYLRSKPNSRFDEWMLDKLQASYVEMSLFASYFDSDSRFQDVIILQREIRQDRFKVAWFNDGFTKDVEARSDVYTSSMSTPSELRQFQS